MTTRKYNRFGRGGCFKCSSCELMTRDTGQSDDGADGLCRRCYDLAGMENGVSDNGDATINDYLSEATKLYQAIIARGGKYDFWTSLGPAVLAKLTEPKKTPAAAREARGLPPIVTRKATNNLLAKICTELKIESNVARRKLRRAGLAAPYTDEAKIRAALS